MSRGAGHLSGSSSATAVAFNQLTASHLPVSDLQQDGASGHTSELQWHCAHSDILDTLALPCNKSFKSQVFGHWHCFIGRVVLDTLNDCDALHVLGLLEREDEGTVILQNVRNYSYNNTVSHCRRL